ncbi:MAG TPA: DUF2613 family protein [Mycobacterium sp.]|nr:DUF2613 family protein [Mycobacterium sp.]
MYRLPVLAAISLLVGLLLGAAVIIGVTRAVERGAEPAFVRDGVQRPASHQVEYGDRCVHGHCVPRVPRCWHGHCLH